MDSICGRESYFVSCPRTSTQMRYFFSGNLKVHWNGNFLYFQFTQPNVQVPQMNEDGQKERDLMSKKNKTKIYKLGNREGRGWDRIQ